MKSTLCQYSVYSMQKSRPSKLSRMNCPSALAHTAPRPFVRLPTPHLSYTGCCSGLTYTHPAFHVFAWNTLSTPPCLVNSDTASEIQFKRLHLDFHREAPGPVSLPCHLHGPHLPAALTQSGASLGYQGLSGSLRYDLLKDKDPVLLL